MPRKTIIFGNGLGMALDSDFFSLNRALYEVWETDNVLDEHSKELITNCLPNQHERPYGEDDLDILQYALSASEFLAALPRGGTQWLSEHGQNFPRTVREFIYRTALKFRQHPRGLPNSFLEPLINFVSRTKTHIATLNYDNLLYQPMIERSILCRYDGSLVDGIYDRGFQDSNLDRWYNRSFGYYLHLHGSPLFIDRGGVIIKLRENELVGPNDVISSHIVLTHVKHKLNVISASALLTSYWRRLIKAFRESEEIILFGYSGRDNHLNDLIKISAEDKRIRIIERTNNREHSARLYYWKNLLRPPSSPEIPTVLIQVPNVLDFTDWEAE